MNTVTNVDTQNLDRISNELTAATADVALLERLKGAEALVSRLTAEYATAIAKRDTAMQLEAKALADARFNGTFDVEVSDTTPNQGVLGSSFQITYTQLVWDMYANASTPQGHAISGFNALPAIILGIVDKA